MSDEIEVLSDDAVFQALTVCAVVRSDEAKLVALYAYELSPQQVKEGWRMKAEAGEAGQALADPSPAEWINKFTPGDGAYGTCQLDFEVTAFGNSRGQKIVEHEFTKRGFLPSDDAWEEFGDWILKFFHKKP